MRLGGGRLEGLGIGVRMVKIRLASGKAKRGLGLLKMKLNNP